MSKSEIDAILKYIESLDKKIDQFKQDAHGLLKGSMERLEKTLEKIVATLNVHDEDIRSLKEKVECIEREKKERQNDIKELKRTGWKVFFDIIKSVVFPIVVVLALIWLGVR